NEAERCDRVSFMHAGRVLVSDTPAALIERRGVQSLEDACVAYLEEAVEAQTPAQPATPDEAAVAVRTPAQPAVTHRAFDLRRLLSYARREGLELRRDPIRLTLAILGSAILMLVMGYGISMDVEDLRFAVLDRDGSTLSRDYLLNVSGSRYFIEQPPLRDDADLDARMRAGEIALAIGAWIDGSMPMRAETVRGYVQGMHAQWLGTRARELLGSQALAAAATIETRFRYNPDLLSLVAMVPAVIPILLMLIPAMLTAMSVVREKELGSILNFYVTPVTRLEFLLGKQLPYVLLATLSYLLLAAMALWPFRVPFTGSFAAL